MLTLSTLNVNIVNIKLLVIKKGTYYEVYRTVAPRFPIAYVR